MPAFAFIVVSSMLFYSLISCNSVVDRAHELLYEKLDIPAKHAQLFFNSFPKLAEACRNDESCQFREQLLNNNDTDLRWGYEMDSAGKRRYSQPSCPGSHVGFVKDKAAQLETFFYQADFGFVRQQMTELRLMCEPQTVEDSSLECSKNLRFCTGRNLFIDLRDVAKRKEPIRYQMDVLSEGQIGGYCNFNEAKLKAELDHLSALQSWAPELRFFKRLDRRPLGDRYEKGDCDVVVEKPTIVMKLDATVNMYHHFCDFFNLYASLHVNSTQPHFYSRDVNILVWETFLYHSAFGETFKAFTSNPLMDITTFQGKRVCFKNLMFPLLPRMIFGLYYNTPVVCQCQLPRRLYAYPNEMFASRYRAVTRVACFGHSPSSFSIDFESRNTSRSAIQMFGLRSYRGTPSIDEC